MHELSSNERILDSLPWRCADVQPNDQDHLWFLTAEEESWRELSKAHSCSCCSEVRFADYMFTWFTLPDKTDSVGSSPG